MITMKIQRKKNQRIVIASKMECFFSHHLFEVNNINTRTMCEICSKIAKTTERRNWRRSVVFIGNFGQISHLVLVFLLLILSW